ncbi:hypothetical protein [Pedobacter gandavensis]|uniref:hypothetical protein n=1 Tax=Pedobacter gandavensis TaxID=2679963 RepID=UPI00293192D7|nr:hypothetical protein [Pedobacter gandavensis]
MNRIYIIFVILVVSGGSVVAQNKKKTVKKKINPFEMVHVGDSVRTKLYNFLWHERKDSLKAGISIYHVLGKDKAKNYQFVEGVYSFKMMGPHFPLYYFIYTKKDGIQIITDYDLEGLLVQVVNCFKRNLDSFSEVERIAYIQAMLKNLNLRNESYGDEVLNKSKVKE